MKAMAGNGSPRKGGGNTVLRLTSGRIVPGATACNLADSGPTMAWLGPAIRHHAGNRPAARVRE